MPETSKIISILESFAPLETAEDWDNSGWQINLHKEVVNKILSCLTVTEDVLELAVQLGVDLIITHHPLIFAPIKKLENPIYIKAIQNNIGIYCAHTNFDKAKGGTSDILAQKLGLTNTYAINDYVKAGELPFEMPLDKLVTVVKNSYEIENFKLINKIKKEYVKKIAVCAGSGAEFISDLNNDHGIDVYITSDIKYHAALEVKGMALFDIGHFQSERFFPEKIKEIFAKESTEVIIANEKPAWTIV